VYGFIVVDRAKVDEDRGAVRTGERRLLAAALGGDEAALVELARLLTPAIQVRVARALLRRSGSRGRGGAPRSELDDMTQEVFVRLFAHGARVLRAWDPERGLSLVNFVGLVAEREVSNVFQSNRRAPWSDKLELREDMEAEEAWTIHLGDERRHIYRDLLVKVCRRLDAWLSPRGRELFDELYLEERPLAEVAADFDMKPSAIYAWRNRVGRRARELLEELQAEGELGAGLGPAAPAGPLGPMGEVNGR
jgi:RNA polymerase sigma-70 factor (ECF subfamily)